VAWRELKPVGISDTAILLGHIALAVAQTLVTGNKEVLESMVNRKKASMGIAALLGGVFLAGSLQAAPVIYFGEDTDGSLTNAQAAEADFLSNLTGVTVEDFEGLTAGDTFPINISFGTTTATLSGTSTIGNTGIADSGIGGRFAVSGTQYLNLGTSDANSFTLTFDTAQAAFGFYGTDIGDFSGQLTISLDGGPAIEIPHTVNAPNGSDLYFGLIDVANPFTTIQFSSGVLSDAFGFDDFTIGTREQVVDNDVSAPGSLAVLGASLLGLGLARRRRKT
jgi:MYXO-CTERM domain-containing protein